MEDVSEFEAFLARDFGAVRSAASLLQATNAGDDEVDVATALKKLQFDAAECDRRISALTAASHSELLHNVFAVEAVHDRIDSVLVPANRRLQTAYRRIEDELVRPYEDAERLNKAFGRIHDTLQLLRGCSFFLLFVQQLEGEKEDLDEDVGRKAQMLRSVAQFYTDFDREVQGAGEEVGRGHSVAAGNQGGREPDFSGENGAVNEFAGVLRSVRLVQEYKPQLEQKWASFCTTLSNQISHDLGHHSSFSPTNLSLQSNLAALHVMSPSAFMALLESAAIAKSIQVSLASLTRALQSPRLLVSTFADVQSASATFVSTLAAVLSVQDTRTSRPLLAAVESALGSSLASVFYERLASKFKKALAVTLARGGPISRNLRAHYPEISQAVRSMPDPAAAARFGEAISLLA